MRKEIVKIHKIMIKGTDSGVLDRKKSIHNNSGIIIATASPNSPQSPN